MATLAATVLFGFGVARGWHLAVSILRGALGA
jgi:hypothetical protein